MHIELECVRCKKSLAIAEIPSEDCLRIPHACVKIDTPLCEDCANVYMYSGGTMNLEQPRALSLENKGEVLYKIAPIESIMG